jgi:hypothetical protein
VQKTRSANPVKRRRQSWLLRFSTVHNNICRMMARDGCVFAKNVDNIILLDRIRPAPKILSHVDGEGEF